MNVQRDICLQKYNGLAIPASARYLTEVASLADLKLALSFAQQRSLSVLVLGEGSNTIFADDYPGLVILNRLLGVEVLEESANDLVLGVQSGENWHSLVAHSIVKNWFGLQNLALIPGLVGAAPMQNIGAYGVELSDVLAWVEFVEIDSGETHRLDNSECAFGYRESRFKHEFAGKVVITRVGLHLSKLPSVNVSYPALKNRFTSVPSPKQVFEAVCEIRSSKLPLPSDIPNVGSFFKNPIVTSQTHQQLKQRFPTLVSFKFGDAYKLAAAWMIDYSGWKQKNIDGVRVHQEQALVLVNPEKRPGRSVLNFAHAIQADVKDTFDVDLEIEPRIHG